MRSKGNAPTSAQKRWREAVRELGSVISGEPAVIHHPVGTTGKHNKVDIGHWWVIPLTDEEHKALHAGGKPWENLSIEHAMMTRKEFEKQAYEEVRKLLFLYEVAVDLPPYMVDVSIENYHR